MNRASRSSQIGVGRLMVRADRCGLEVSQEEDSLSHSFLKFDALSQSSKMNPDQGAFGLRPTPRYPLSMQPGVRASTRKARYRCAVYMDTRVAGSPITLYAVWPENTVAVSAPASWSFGRVEQHMSSWGLHGSPGSNTIAGTEVHAVSRGCGLATRPPLTSEDRNTVNFRKEKPCPSRSDS